MEFKGTKGEWSQNGFAVFVGEKEIINENVICRFHCGLENYQGSEYEANAKLIACAPEMLEMLIIMKDYLGSDNRLIVEQLIKKATE